MVSSCSVAVSWGVAYHLEDPHPHLDSQVDSMGGPKELTENWVGVKALPALLCRKPVHVVMCY